MARRAENSEGEHAEHARICGGRDERARLAFIAEEEGLALMAEKQPSLITINGCAITTGRNVTGNCHTIDGLRGTSVEYSGSDALVGMQTAAGTDTLPLKRYEPAEEKLKE